MKTRTLKELRACKPCYDPVRWVPEGWEGTATDFLNIKECPTDLAAYYAAYSAARSAAYSAANSAADSAAYSAECEWQVERLKEYAEEGI